MENEKTFLKPCPFCGGQVVGIRTSMMSDKVYALEVRHSDKCFLRYADDPYVSFDKKTLIRKWNTRYGEKRKADEH